MKNISILMKKAYSVVMLFVLTTLTSFAQDAFNSEPISQINTQVKSVITPVVTLIQYLFGFGALVCLVILGINIMQGKRESDGKLATTIGVFVVIYLLMFIIKVLFLRG